MNRRPIDRHFLSTDNAEDARVTIETLGHEDELVVLAMVGPRGEAIRTMPAARQSVVLNAGEAAALVEELTAWLAPAKGVDPPQRGFWPDRPPR